MDVIGGEPVYWRTRLNNDSLSTFLHPVKKKRSALSDYFHQTGASLRFYDLLYLMGGFSSLSPRTRRKPKYMSIGDTDFANL
ncbi:MAG: hypothetical protein JW863_06580, partial [Chitinispirillaceae bacterium]|nr:hypothetical protein [Chitinispirillaceae bacterium]